MLDGSIPIPGNGSADKSLGLESNPVSAFTNVLKAGAPPTPNTSNTNPQNEQVVILEQFRNLPPEQGVIRTLQSIKDSLMNENKTLKEKLDETARIAKFAGDLTEDKELQKSFAVTYFPELFTEKTVEQKVTETLQNEFGKDFKPDPDEEQKRGSKTYRYYKKMDILYDKFETEKNSDIPLLKDLADARAKEKKAKADEYNAKVAKLRKERNLSDSDITTLHRFIGSLELDHFWDILQFQLQYGNNGTKPDVTAIPNAGSSFPNEGFKEKFVQVEDYVTNILGPIKRK